MGTQVYHACLRNSDREMPISIPPADGSCVTSNPVLILDCGNVSEAAAANGTFIGLVCILS